MRIMGLFVFVIIHFRIENKVLITQENNFREYGSQEIQFNLGEEYKETQGRLEVIGP